MVEFGRVEGVVEIVPEAQVPQLRLTVTLETQDDVRLVRCETLDAVRTITTREDLSWHADQWTQETIGVDLAEQGWEVLGASNREDRIEAGPPRSATYSVRRLFRPPMESSKDGSARCSDV